MIALHIAGRELRSLFVSPLAWAVLGVVQAVLAYIFLIQVDAFLDWQPRLAGLEGAPGVTAIVVAPLLRSASIVLLMVTPLLTMRLIAEERRAGTLTLLLAAPVTMTEIVLGKFLGIMGFFALLIAVLALMPLSLLAGGSLDAGLVASGFLGLGLVTMSFVAAGLFMSTLTSQPAAAAVATFGLLLMLWIVDWAGRGSQSGSELLAYLSLIGHLDALLRGVVDSRDLAFYGLFTVLFLALSVRRLDAVRTTG